MNSSALTNLTLISCDAEHAGALVMLDDLRSVLSYLRELQKKFETADAQVNAYLAAGVSWDGSGWVNTRALRAEAKLAAVKSIIENAVNQADAEESTAALADHAERLDEAKFRRATIMSVAVPCVVEIERLP